MTESRERAETLGRIRIQFGMAIKRLTELDVLLDANPVSFPTVMMVAKEIAGHLYMIVKLAGSQARAEVLAKWKAEQKKGLETPQIAG